MIASRKEVKPILAVATWVAVSAATGTQLDRRWLIISYSCLCGLMSTLSTRGCKWGVLLLAFVFALSFHGCELQGKEEFAVSFHGGEQGEEEICEYFDTEERYFHDTNLRLVNASREDFDFWFTSEFRGVFSLIYRREVGHTSPDGYEYSQTYIDNCFDNLDKALTQSLLYQPCSSSSDPLTLCDDAFCEFPLKSCFDGFFATLRTEIPSNINAQATEYLVWEDKSHLRSKILEWFTLMADFQCTPQRPRPHNECIYIHTNSTRGLSQPKTVTTDQCVWDLPVASSVVAGLVTLAVFFGIPKRFYCSADEQDEDETGGGEKQLKKKDLKRDLFSLTFLVTLTGTMFYFSIMLTFSIRTAQDWHLHALLTIPVLLFCCRKFFARASGCSVRKERHWVFALLREISVGGELFKLYHVCTECIDVMTQFLDVETRLVRELDSDVILIYVLLMGTNVVSLVGSPLLCRNAGSLAAVALFFDLSYIFLKWFHHDKESEMQLGYTALASLVVPLLSLANTGYFLHDWLLKRESHNSQIHPSESSVNNSAWHTKNNTKELIQKLGNLWSTNKTVTVGVQVILGCSGLVFTAWVLIAHTMSHQVCEFHLSKCVWDGVYPRILFPRGHFSAPSCSVELARVINASGCGLDEVPFNLENASTVSILDFRGNPLKQLSKWIPKHLEESPSCTILLDPWLNITVAKWDGAALTRFPKAALALIPTVEDVDLGENFIQEIPSNITDHLTRLKSIRLANNKLRFITPGAFSHDTLCFIDLSNNELRSVPNILLQKYFEPSHEECEVSLRGNPIASISHRIRNVLHVPEDLKLLDNLKRLEVDCMLPCIATFTLTPQQIVEKMAVPSLEQLILRGILRPPTPEEIDFMALAELEHLVFLKLANNNLSGRVPKVLSELTNLLTLDLSGNGFTGTLPHSMFEELRNLKSLSLRGNRLNGPLPSSIHLSPRLESLDLSENWFSGSLFSDLLRVSSLRILQLESNGFYGTIPVELPFLSNLQVLTLGGNSIRGTIPREIGKFEQLKLLQLSGTSNEGTLPTQIGKLPGLRELILTSLRGLYGTIPTEFGRLTSLERLVLSSTSLQGTIPHELGALENLRMLYLGWNSRISGTLPTELGELSSLESLHVLETPLSGTIPTEFGYLTSLERLVFSSTSLTGTIPRELRALENLRMLYLESNSQISGTLPTELGELSSLESLHVLDTPLSGTIPTEFGHLTSLERLVFSSTSLTGTIPRELRALKNLRMLDLEWNSRISGTLPTELGELTGLRGLILVSLRKLNGTIPTEFGRLTSLERLVLTRTSLTGSIPRELRALENLRVLNLERNSQISGTLPTELGELSSLEHLHVLDTPFSGTIPAELGNLSHLRNLQLGISRGSFRSSLSGTIPRELGALSRVETFWIIQANVTGSIPSELGGLSSLQFFALFDSPLSGPIPSELGQLTTLNYIYLFHTSLSRQVPSELGNLNQLEIVWIVQNQFSGTLPSELGRLENLQELSMSENKLSGTIPSELGNLGRVRYLDLESNRLSGTVPSALGRMTNLQELRLANNRLTGTIPWEILRLPSLWYVTFDGQDSRPGEEQVATEWWKVFPKEWQEVFSTEEWP